MSKKAIGCCWRKAGITGRHYESVSITLRGVRMTEIHTGCMHMGHNAFRTKNERELHTSWSPSRDRKCIDRSTRRDSLVYELVWGGEESISRRLRRTAQNSLQVVLRGSSIKRQPRKVALVRYPSHRHPHPISELPMVPSSRLSVW